MDESIVYKKPEIISVEIPKNDFTPKRLYPVKKTIEFVISDNTRIPFGKLKGQPHKVFKKIKHRKYCEWILDQKDFYFNKTQDYIEENVEFY